MKAKACDSRSGYLDQTAAATEAEPGAEPARPRKKRHRGVEREEQREPAAKGQRTKEGKATATHRRPPFYGIGAGRQHTMPFSMSVFVAVLSEPPVQVNDGDREQTTLIPQPLHTVFEA